MMCTTGSPTSSEEGGIWEMREVIQIGDTLKMAVFYFLIRSYATRTNVLSDSNEGSGKFSTDRVSAGLPAPTSDTIRIYGRHTGLPAL